MMAPAARQARPVSSRVRIILERIESCHMLDRPIRDHQAHWRVMCVINIAQLAFSRVKRPSAYQFLFFVLKLLFYGAHPNSLSEAMASSIMPTRRAQFV